MTSHPPKVLLVTGPIHPCAAGWETIRPGSPGLEDSGKVRVAVLIGERDGRRMPASK